MQHGQRLVERQVLPHRIQIVVAEPPDLADGLVRELEVERLEQGGGRFRAKLHAHHPIAEGRGLLHARHKDDAGLDFKNIRDGIGHQVNECLVGDVLQGGRVKGAHAGMENPLPVQQIPRLDQLQLGGGKLGDTKLQLLVAAAHVLGRGRRECLLRALGGRTAPGLARRAAIAGKAHRGRWCSCGRC